MALKQISSNKLQAGLYAILCILLWGLIPVVAKVAQSDLDSKQFLFWSSLVSFVTIASIALVAGTWRGVLSYQSRDWLAVTGNGLLGTFLYYLLLYQGYQLAQGVEVLVTQYTWPVSICVLSVFLLKESWNRFKTLSVLLGFCGVILVLSKGDFSTITIENPIAIAWVFVGAFCFALFSVLSKKFAYEPISLTAVYFLVATVASGLAIVWQGELQVPSGNSLLAVLVNGVLVNGISYLFWLQALKKANASFVTPFTFATPCISLLYLVMFFDEAFLVVYVTAFAMIVAAGVLANKTPDNLRPSASQRSVLRGGNVEKNGI